MPAYGTELVLDLAGCDLESLTEQRLTTFFVDLCDLIRMKRHGDPVLWTDDSGVPHLHGISGFQFIETSNVVCHALPMLRAVYINIFSCKDFNVSEANRFCEEYWAAAEVHATVLTRR